MCISPKMACETMKKDLFEPSKKEVFVCRVPILLASQETTIDFLKTKIASWRGIFGWAAGTIAVVIYLISI